MPSKERNLFDRIATFPALLAASRRAAQGKRNKPGVAAFLANQEKELLRLERELRSGRYRPGRYTTIEIFDPKHRLVSAVSERDRVVHHAFCAVCEPLFERGFIHDSYANRTGKGTHRAIARYDRFRDRFRYVLRCDIYRYFPAIDHAILKRDLRRRLARALAGRDVWLIDGDRQSSAQTAIRIRAEAGYVPGIACAPYPDGSILRAQVQQQVTKFEDIIIDAGGRDSTALRAALLKALAPDSQGKIDRLKILS